MSAALSITLPASLAPRARIAKELGETYSRDLTEGDILLLLTKTLGTEASPLKRISEAHHRLAKLLADGIAPEECSIITNRSVGNVYALRNDPAFQNLIAYYREAKQLAYINMHESISSLGATAVSVLQERMETDPDSFSNDDLRKTAELGLDRSGFGPTKKVVSVNATDVLRELKEKLTPKGKIIEREV